MTDDTRRTLAEILDRALFGAMGAGLSYPVFTVTDPPPGVGWACVLMFAACFAIKPVIRER